MGFTASITKRDRVRTLTSGATVVQTKFVVNFRHPVTGRRKQIFTKSQKEAVAQRDEVVARVVTGAPMQNLDLSIAKAVQLWLEDRKSEVKKATWQNYCNGTHYIVAPLLVGSSKDRKHFTDKGIKRPGAEFIETLGNIRVADLSTAQIRSWHRTISEHVGSYTANLAKKFLRAALALAAEDFGLRVPVMPSKLGGTTPGEEGHPDA